jgi:hypothetical protein
MSVSIVIDFTVCFLLTAIGRGTVGHSRGNAPTAARRAIVSSALAKAQYPAASLNAR